MTGKGGANVIGIQEVTNLLKHYENKPQKDGKVF